MSGDVQPRKRKDKKRKKDELGVDEGPRGTAAALGEGDVFMHSPNDHGTGGHWCAKIIFFSLLAVLVTLIGLIILENRGLSELEANSVESRYSGVLEGWLEDAPDDDHHDEHTLELKHHDDDDDEDHDDHDDQSRELDHDDEDEDHDDDDEEGEDHDDDDEAEDHGDDEADDHDDDEDEGDDDNTHEDDDDDDQKVAESDEDGDDHDVVDHDADNDDDGENEGDDHSADDDDDDDDNDDQQDQDSAEQGPNKSIEDDDDVKGNIEESSEDNDNDDLQKVDENETAEDNDDDDDDDDDDQIDDRNDSLENNDADGDDESNENEQDDKESRENEDEEEHEEEEDDLGVEVERLEKEVSDEDALSEESPAADAENDDNDDEASKEVASEDVDGADDDGDDDGVAEDEEFLEPGDIEEELPVVEHIVAPKGKPLIEVEEEPSTAKPVDTLAEEEEYEKQQEELRKEQEQASHKDGGNSIEDDWPGEPSDQYWRQQLDQAEEELRQGEWSAASKRAGATQLAGSARARWLLARAADAEAEARRDNRLLTRAITAYLDLLKMNERLTDHKLLQVAHRTLDRIRFRGNYLSAEPVYRLLIRRFPDVPGYYNNLTISFLMANRADLAEQVLKDTLKKWPDDRVALAHHGFVLKTRHNRLEEAVEAFQKALQNDTGPATESRFYYHLGDSLLLLGRYAEAHEVHKRGAAMGYFLSPSQRSLYNVDRLKSRPWWNIEQTPYTKLARALERSWKEILKEGEAAKALYEKEKEGLKERGEWSQLDLFVRGQEIPNRCKRAPVTCSIVRSEVAASGCRRGQVKFSAMEAGTHVRPHVGPTNCRLRMHLGLSNTKDTYIRVDKETRQWQVGKTFMFDDSFEHEVWHNGTGTRLVLIVDVWHPDLTPAERRSLPPI
ncbi:aspartyl/asparaginyl beta-hydroxylase isoform X3 [Spodoptera litura]|uniref:Aspartyl/asparaginyl beta-hydroxylase isoform X3 n=1 Tax=Spodoptera litura TaxID=69820 RepID=A0A9J7IT40_SPOLT|nr:aspartyl/asparaginyl beta-hydroxylase isoform X3 [Spodoptera litura]